MTGEARSASPPHLAAIVQMLRPPFLNNRLFMQVACELELWQEAFRSVEDIQNLFVMGKRPGKPQMMAIFYARLTKIFTVSEYHLQNG